MTFKDFVRFLPFSTFEPFRSYFSTRNRYDMPKPAEPWSAVIPRMPMLLDGEHTTHIDIAYRGEYLPVDAVNLRGVELAGTHMSDFIGIPKAAKSTTLEQLHTHLRRRNILHRIHWEPNRIDLPHIRNSADLNVIRALRIMEILEAKRSAARDGGDLKLTVNFRLVEQGIYHSLVWADHLEEHTKRPSRLSEVISLLDTRADWHDVVFVLDLPINKSIARGTKMGTEQLSAFRTAIDRFPTRVRDLSERSGRPLAIIWIDTDRRDKRETAGFALRSYGTLLRRFGYA